MQNTEVSQRHRQLLTEKIVDVAANCFLSKGIKAVKMDDIAKVLGISKRTLYETFDNKEKLLLACVKRMSEETEEHIDNYISVRQPSVIEIIVEFYRYQLERLNLVSSAFYMEIHKYPSVTEWLEKEHDRKEREGLAFFKKGVDEGFFRKDVNYELINEVCVGAMEYVFEHQLIKRYSLSQIFKDVTMLYIRGFCTMKGIECLEKMLSPTPRTRQDL